VDTASTWEIVPLDIGNVARVTLIADWLWDMWGRHNGRSLADEIAKLKLRHGVAPSISPTFVAQSLNGALVGTIGICPSDYADRPDLSPWISALFVPPDRRGQGIGSALIRHSCQILRQSGYDSAYLWSEESNAPYYQRIGARKLTSVPRGVIMEMRINERE